MGFELSFFMSRIPLFFLFLGVGCGFTNDPLVEAPSLVLPELPPLASERTLKRGVEVPFRELRIAFTGALRGEVQPCGCPTLPYGGFARRDVFLRTLTAEGFPVFQLDAGEALLKGVSHHGREDASRRAQAILDLMKIVGVQVMALGPTDLIAMESIGGFQSSTELMVVNGGWVRDASKGRDSTGLFTSRAWTVLKEGGLSIGVIGLSGDSNSAELVSSYRRQDLITWAQSVLAELPDSVDLVVGLGSFSSEEAVALAEAVPEIQLLLSTAGSVHEEPRVHNGVVIVETPPRGRYITTLRFLLGSDNKQELVIQGKEVRALELLNQRREQAAAMGEQNLTEAKKIKLSEAIRDLYSRSNGLNLLSVEQRPLGSMFDQPSVVDDYVGVFFEDLIEEAVEVSEEATAPERPKEVYATPSNCVRCHIQEFGQWAYSSHKSATVSLTERVAHKNPECLSCHSTGFGKKGGFGEPTPFNLSRLGGVQCEACHGPLAGHPEDDTIVPEPITEQTCLVCHDAANSPEFDYEAYRHKIRCDRGL
jgi:hypothetical protein